MPASTLNKSISIWSISTKKRNKTILNFFFCIIDSIGNERGWKHRERRKTREGEGESSSFFSATKESKTEEDGACECLSD